MREGMLSILHGPHNVRQFCTIPAVTGIDHRVFQRGKVLQHNSGRGKILASNNNLFYAIFFISAKESFLNVDPNAVENMATYILCSVAGGMAGVLILGRCGRKLQQILLALIDTARFAPLPPGYNLLLVGRFVKSSKRHHSFFG